MPAREPLPDFLPADDPRVPKWPLRIEDMTPEQCRNIARNRRILEDREGSFLSFVLALIALAGICGGLWFLWTKLHGFF